MSACFRRLPHRRLDSRHNHMSDSLRLADVANLDAGFDRRAGFCVERTALPDGVGDALVTRES